MNNLQIESLNQEIEKLDYFSYIIGTAIVNRNGLLISSKLPRDIDDRKFGAMAATMYEAIEAATLTLKNKKINHVTVEYNDYQLIIVGTNYNIILVLLVDLNVNLGLIFIEIEECIKNIEYIINR